LKKELLDDLPDLLQVRKAALLLMDPSGNLALSGALHISGKPRVTAAEVECIPALLLRQSSPGDPFFDRVDWAHLAAPLRIQERTLGLWILGAKEPDGEFDARDASFVRRAAAAAAIAAENARLFEALQDLAQERLRIRQAERQELAARLHDEPLQQAAFLASELGGLLANDGIFSPDQAASLRRQEQEVHNLAGTLRDICTGLHPPVLDLGLEPTLREVVENARRRWTGSKIELSLPPESGAISMLSREAMDAVYHIATEALTNTAKHADAAHIQVQLQMDSEILRLIIEDDGCGMPEMSISPSELIRGRHFGLAGMFQWAVVAGGRLEIGPGKPHGTRVVLEFTRFKAS
jgi:signal transduction histidine kinase